MLESQLPLRQRPLDSTNIYSHSRTRTTSSSIFPPTGPTPMQPYAPIHLGQPPMMNNNNNNNNIHSRRSPSVGTFSSVSSVGMVPPAAYRTSPTADIRRSTSSRSGGGGGGGGTPTQSVSYVALLRKQKATVWCDRAQYEDPRLQAQQRAAKMRAHMEVSGSNSYGSGGSGHGGLGGGSGSGGRTSTGLSAGGKMAAKIRHHGKPAVVGYSPDSNYVGVGGVPLRLSATEVEAEDSDEDDSATMQKLHHHRTGSSGRSSTASGRRGLGYRSSGGGLGSQSAAMRRWSPGDTPERTGSLVEEHQQHQQQHQYHQQQMSSGGIVRDDAASGKAHSTGSGSSAERADNVPDLGGSRMPANSANLAAVTREKSVKSVDDLRRRGSVDERTMTLSTGRLYIANPD